MAKQKQTPAGIVLIKSLIAEKQGQAWLKEKIYDEGPPHKQAQHALVLERLNVLIHQSELLNATAFKPVAGENITLEKHDHSLLLPLGFPVASLADSTDVALVDKLTKGPDHEIAYTAVLLQAIEWMIEQNNGG